MFGKEEKEGRQSALKKLMDVMGGETSKKLHGLKKSPMAPAENEEEGEGLAPPEDAPIDGEEISEEDKAKIVELYEKFCR